MTRSNSIRLWRTAERYSCQAGLISVPSLGFYLRGNTIETGKSRGWVLVCVEGIGLGWGKESNGILKNHYPKGLRINY